MGNKINPLGFRLGVNKTASAKWYADPKTYPKLLGEDDTIREAVMKDVGHAGISRIDIERAAHNINITIHTAKPGVVIGRGGESIKALALRSWTRKSAGRLRSTCKRFPTRTRMLC